MNGCKDFYKQFFTLYAMLVLQNVVTLSVNLADNIMLGAYSEMSLSGAAAVNQIQFVFQQLLVAMGDALVVLSAQYWGKDAKENATRIMAAAIRFADATALLLFFVVSVFPRQMMRIFTESEPIVSEGMGYLDIIRFSYLFFAFTQILLASLRSKKVVKIAFYLSVMTFFVNCGINYAFIFGNFGLPELGIRGAAIGTLVARILETFFLAIFIVKSKKLAFSLLDFGRTSKAMTSDYLKIMLPMLLVQGLWGINTMLQTVILGHMNSAAIAANSAASTLFLLVKSTAVGAAGAASVMIGTAVGSGNIDLVKTYAKKMQRIFVIVGVCSGTLLYFLRIPVLSLYRMSDEAMYLANAFLVVLSVVCVGMSYQMPTNSGIIKGGGNTNFVVIMDLISIWLIVIPLSVVMAFVFKASPIVVVCCLNADQIFKCVPAYLESHYGNWIRKLTRD